MKRIGLVVGLLSMLVVSLFAPAPRAAWAAQDLSSVLPADTTLYARISAVRSRHSPRRSFNRWTPIWVATSLCDGTPQGSMTT